MAKCDDSSPQGRRTFFKQAAARFIQPVADYVDAQIGDYLPNDVLSPSCQSLDTSILRPPGALPEATFLQTCERSGDCIESCPAEALRAFQSSNPNVAGTPYISPNSQPCVVCDSLACMQVCPSGALQKLSVNQIQIGLAEVSYDTCLRTEGIECSYCVDNCPIGDTAIRIDSEDRIEVRPRGCVGCGVCQHECPTVPKSVVVKHWTDAEHR